LEYHKGLEDDFFENYEISKTIEHPIRRRESLWKLTQNVYEVPFWLVARYNPGLFEKGVNVGDKVIFPVVVPKEKNS
jgi:hypothetical protein